MNLDTKIKESACRGNWQQEAFGKSLASPCVRCLNRAAAHITIAVRQPPQFDAEGNCPDRKEV